jgi:hypothetical protein
VVTARLVAGGYGRVKAGAMRGDVMSQQSVRQAARRSALDAQAVLRKDRADRERRLEALAVAVLTAFGERDALIRDAERRDGQALRTMTEDEGLSAREAAGWCGSGVTVREIVRLLRPDAARFRPMTTHLRPSALFALGVDLAADQAGAPSSGRHRIDGPAEVGGATAARSRACSGFGRS